jgi:hypothetical protein
VSEWHGRDIFVPNPNRTHVCVPPPFSGAPGAGGPVEWGGGGCAGGGASRVSAGGGAKFSIFQFSCSMAQKIDTGSDNYGKTNRTSRSGGFAEFRPIPGRLWGGTGRPGAVSDPVYTGRCVAVRANTARGCPQAPLTAEKPPSYSPAHRRPTHSRRPAYTDETARQPAHHSKTNELPARRSAAELSGGVRSRPGGPRLDAS